MMMVITDNDEQNELGWKINYEDYSLIHYELLRQGGGRSCGFVREAPRFVSNI